ncbi:hypothetical protein GIB67_029722 [Kingdonia uniflora]|uniref:Uncharacterized protein n=1 Tax=Kingdonia uniflora TaxID=39325 RepID=A0A7J7LLR9_9MAGN|nr:hypothetical protein GIB67_029722 [Kingdonia uniflora]
MMSERHKSTKSVLTTKGPATDQSNEPKEDQDDQRLLEFIFKDGRMYEYIINLESYKDGSYKKRLEVVKVEDQAVEKRLTSKKSDFGNTRILLWAMDNVCNNFTTIFPNVAEMTLSYFFKFSYVLNEKENYFTYTVDDSFVLTRWVLDLEWGLQNLKQLSVGDNNGTVIYIRLRTSDLPTFKGRRNLDLAKDGKFDFFPTTVASRLVGEMNRPSMGYVVQVLEGVVEVGIPPVLLYLQNLVDNLGHERDDMECSSESSLVTE